LDGNGDCLPGVQEFGTVRWTTRCC